MSRLLCGGVGALTVSSVLTSFWRKDQLRIPVDLWFKSMPDHFYGVGYDDGRNTPQSDSTTAYNRTWFWFNPRFLFQIKGPLYAGLDWDINYTRADDPGTVMLEDPTFQSSGDEVFNHGLGAVLQYDSRDVPVNAWRGTYFSGRARCPGPNFHSRERLSTFGATDGAVTGTNPCCTPSSSTVT